MTVVLKSNTDLVVPPSVRRRAGIKAGDRLEFRASHGAITIKAVGPPTYKATKAEFAAIRKGEAEIARGEYVNLGDLLHGLDRPRRKSGTKTANPAALRSLSDNPFSGDILKLEGADKPLASARRKLSHLFRRRHCL